MKTKNSKFMLLTGLIIFLCSLTYSQGTVKIVGPVDLPNSMSVNQTKQFSVTVTNNGNTDWSSSSLRLTISGSLKCKIADGKSFTLKPGSSKTVYFNLTAPKKKGRCSFTIIIFTGQIEAVRTDGTVEVVGEMG